MPVDAAYALTRRDGKQATITKFADAGYSFDPETGDETGGETTYTVRFVYKEDTKYKRIIAANTVESNIGSTTFIMWLKDTERAGFGRLDGEDFITYEGERYDVVSYAVEHKTSVVVTANQVVRT